MTSDFMGSQGDPYEAFRLIAGAGIQLAHVCHRYTGLYFLSMEEMQYYNTVTQELGISICDIHASDGGRDGILWMSDYRFEHRMGMDLIRNRLKFASVVGAGAIVLHVSKLLPEDPQARAKYLKLAEQNLDEIAGWAKEFGVKVGLENTDSFPDNTGTIVALLDISDPEWIGITYDSGHGNIHDSLWFLERYKDRLYVLHLNDNHGPNRPGESGDPDIHLLPFDGTTDFEGIAEILSRSTYNGILTFEVSYAMYKELMTPEEFLELFKLRASEVTRMVIDAEELILLQAD